jgi:hypothetical protein
LNREIVVQKLGWALRVFQNPTNYPCGQENKLGPILSEKAIHRSLFA